MFIFLMPTQCWTGVRIWKKKNCNIDSDLTVLWSKVYSDCTNIDKEFIRIEPLNKGSSYD